jgi:hypothetical protein
MIAANGEKRRRGRMTYSELGRYFSGLTNDKIDRVAQNSEVSRATIYKIRAGKRGRPDNYEKLALALGRTRREQREIYKTLMRLSGYLDLLPDEDSAIDTSLDALVLVEIQRRYPEIYAAALSMIDATPHAAPDSTNEVANQTQ